MVVYYVLLILIAGLAYPLCIKNPTQKKKLIYLIIVFSYMWFLGTFRVNTGYDYQSYIDIFAQIKATSWGELSSLQYENGFMVLSKIMSLFVTSSTAMYGCYTLIILAPIVYFIYRYCDDVWLSTWLYVTMAFFYTNLSFIRQSLAASISILAFGFFIKKKPIPFILIILLAGTFHATALIMIPVYFVAHVKLTPITGTIYGVGALIAFMFSEEIINLVTKYMYTSYRDSIYVTLKLGGHFLLIPLTALVAGVALYVVWKDRDPNAGPFLNILILNATFWIFGVGRHMILERFCMYSYLYTLVILPSALRSLKASPEVIKERDQLKKELDMVKRPMQQKVRRLEVLDEKISDHEKYYGSALVATLLITFMYNSFGIHVNKFHNVMDYQSSIPWFDKFVGLFRKPMAPQEAAQAAGDTVKAVEEILN